MTIPHRIRQETPHLEDQFLEGALEIRHMFVNDLLSVKLYELN